MKKIKIALIFGTRPEIIKLSPVMRFLRKARANYFMIHTGQHYSYDMDRLFFKELELPTPKYNLEAGIQNKGAQGTQTGRMIEGIEAILLRERPELVMVQGDTNSVLAGAIAATKTPGAKLAHVEAGLRSYDRAMPEEINRIVCDHVSDYLFAPTEAAKKILISEGIAKNKIHMTGNTVVDAVKQNLHLANKRPWPSLASRFKNKPYFLMTLHRQENVDNKHRLASIFKGLDKVGREFKKPIIFPIHPRTLKQLKIFKLRVPETIRLIPPVGFLDFLKLETHASLILTDSGGIQEEACLLQLPCVTLRTTTERPETVLAGGNLIAGYDPNKILQCVKKMHDKKRIWKHPFGDGRSAERIVGAL